MSDKRSPRERFLAAASAKTKLVTIPEWDMTVMIQQLSAESLIDKKVTEGEDREASARDIVASVLDDDGNPLFTNADIPAILKWQLQGFVRLMAEIHAFNGVGRIPEIKKNSKKTSSSPSASA